MASETNQPAHFSGVDPLGLEIGFALVPLLESSGEQFLGRMRSVRDRFGARMGFVVPPVHVRDSDELQPNQYRFTARGAPIGQGEIWPEMWLAVQGPNVIQELDRGRPTQEPAYGSPARWIDYDDIELAEAAGYTVVDPQSVIATHLDRLLELYGHELLGRAQVEDLLATLADRSPKLAEDIHQHLSIGTVRQVLQDFLVEHLPIKDLDGICEAMLEGALAGQKDPVMLTEQARQAIGRFIVEWASGGAPVLEVATLNQELERLVSQGVSAAREQGVVDVMEPEAAGYVQKGADELLHRSQAEGRAPILAVQSYIRRAVARTTLPAGIAVIALGEIPNDKPVQVVMSVPEVPAEEDADD